MVMCRGKELLKGKEMIGRSRFRMKYSFLS
jgi:hypothetical protein